jgi:hypothetical protein
VNDPERQELLRRLEEAETAQRRWKAVGLVTGAVLALLLMLGVWTLASIAIETQARAERAQREMEKAMQSLK